MGDGAPSSTKTRYSVGSGLIDESQNNNTIQITSNMRDQNLTSRCKSPELSTGGGGGGGEEADSNPSRGPVLLER